MLKRKLAADRSRTFSRGKEALRTKIQLINTLYSMHVDDPADIDWDEVAQATGNVTSVCVQKAFHRLKVSRVPSWTSLSYCEIVDFLQEKVVPELKERLRQDILQVKEEERQDRYFLSDIFVLEEEEEFTELDNSHLVTVQSGSRLI
ncbi:hypothetical protein LDENG_00226020 [Lucifuga dentata]|nr:hypothetical protein LDENG_00226020 [Lucifuga dentata]